MCSSEPLEANGCWLHCRWEEEEVEEESEEEAVYKVHRQKRDTIRIYLEKSAGRTSDPSFLTLLQTFQSNML